MYKCIIYLQSLTISHISSIYLVIQILIISLQSVLSLPSSHSLSFFLSIYVLPEERIDKAMQCLSWCSKTGLYISPLSEKPTCKLLTLFFVKERQDLEDSLKIYYLGIGD